MFLFQPMYIKNNNNNIKKNQMILEIQLCDAFSIKVT